MCSKKRFLIPSVEKGQSLIPPFEKGGLGGIFIVAFACFLGGCSLFSSKDVAEKPKMPVYTPQVTLTSIWSKSLGAGADGTGAILTPFLFQNTLWTAHYNGVISGVDPENGKERFSFRVKDNLATGPLVSAGKLWVGAANGELLSLARASGQVNWRVPLGSEVTAAPVVQEGVAVIQSVDGVLHALDADTGAVLWASEKQSPVFNLRGVGQPVFYGNQVIAGFANGKLMAFQKENGQPLWERRLGMVQGGSELARLVDIDAAPIIDSGKVYAVAYQGNLIASNPDSGDIIWHRKLSSSSGLVLLDDLLVVPDDGGVVSGFDKTTGVVLWERKELQGRTLLAPVATTDFVAVADTEGFIFVFSKQGRLVGHILAAGPGLSLLSYRTNQFFAVDQKGRATLYRIEGSKK